MLLKINIKKLLIVINLIKYFDTLIALIKRLATARQICDLLSRLSGGAELSLQARNFVIIIKFPGNQINDVQDAEEGAAERIKCKVHLVLKSARSRPRHISPLTRTSHLCLKHRHMQYILGSNRKFCSS